MSLWTALLVTTALLGVERAVYVWIARARLLPPLV
jgi:hypothetical protein